MPDLRRRAAELRHRPVARGAARIACRFARLIGYDGWMKSTLATLLLVTTFAAIRCGTAVAHPQIKPSRQVPINQIPHRVVAALKKEFPKAEILQADQAQDSPLDCDSWSWPHCAADTARRYASL